MSGQSAIRTDAERRRRRLSSGPKLRQGTVTNSLPRFSHAPTLPGVGFVGRARRKEDWPYGPSLAEQRTQLTISLPVSLRCLVLSDHARRARPQFFYRLSPPRTESFKVGPLRVRCRGVPRRLGRPRKKGSQTPTRPSSPFGARCWRLTVSILLAYRAWTASSPPWRRSQE